MSTNIVTAMDEPRLTGTDTLGKADGISKCLVGVMGLLAQGIDHQGVAPHDIRNLFLRNGLHIGNVSQRTDAIAQNGQVVMHHLERHDVKIANRERVMGMNLMQLYSGYTRIAVFGKAIGQHLQHAFTGNGIGIDVDFAKLTVRPDVVHAAYVVVVGVGDEYGVDFAEGLRQHLLAEVGSAVDKYARGGGFHQCRTARALVVRVGALADGALASQNGNAAGCACAKECECHAI